MLLPIVVVVLSLTLPDPAIRWASIAVAVFMVVFNLIGLPYPGLYDSFLIVESIVFCAPIVSHAWRWKIPV